MKNLFKLTDTKILVLILLFFVGGLACMSIYMPQPKKETQPKNFTGVSASGFTYIQGGKTGTIVNH